LPLARGGTGAITAGAARTALGLGTMATQDANNVLITDGDINVTFFTAAQFATTGLVAFGSGTLTLNARLHLFYTKANAYGLMIQQVDTNVSGGEAAIFLNVAGGVIGTISTTATTTGFNTSSDARLKEAIEVLAGALEVLQALRPVAFRWQADGSRGHGFLAHELQRVIPEAVTGEPDAVNEDGSIKPQQVDHSKLIPWLVAGMQELLGRVESLEIQVAALQAQLA